MSTQHPPQASPDSWGPGPAQPLPVTKPTRRKAWLTHGATAIVALLIGTAIGANGNDTWNPPTASEKPQAVEATTPTTEPEPTSPAPETTEAEPASPAPETTTSEATPTKDPGPASTFAGDGEYLVGEDIAPGTYKTAGPDDDFGCYWARLKNASGEFDAIIANNNLNGPGRVTLKKGEYFQTQRCQEWVKTG